MKNSLFWPDGEHRMRSVYEIRSVTLGAQMSVAQSGAVRLVMDI